MNQPELLELDGRPLAEPPRDLGIPSIAWLIGLIALADALVRVGPSLTLGFSPDPLPVAVVLIGGFRGTFALLLPAIVLTASEGTWPSNRLLLVAASAAALSELVTLGATFARAGVSFGSQDLATSWAAAQAAVEESIPSLVPWLLLCALAGSVWPALRRHPGELVGWALLVAGLEALAIAQGAGSQPPLAMALWFVTAAVTLLAFLGWAALGLVAAGRFRRSALWTFALGAAASGLASRLVFVSGGILNTLGLSGLPGLWLLRPALDIAEFVSLAGVLWIAGRRREPGDHSVRLVEHEVDVAPDCP